MSGTSGDSPPPIRVKRRNVPGLRLVIAYVGAAMVTWLALTAIAGLAVDDSICATACHVMRPYETTAERSSHASVGCRKCHATPGPLGFLGDGVALQRRTLGAIVGAQAVLAPVSDAPCRSCHVGVGKGKVESGGIAVRHSDFWNADCTDCHGGMAHAVGDRSYAAPQMDDCLACHSAAANEPSQCGICHIPGSRKDRPGRPVWSVTHGPTWAATHGLGDRSTCVSCHTPAYCAKCHGVALPHPVDWPRTHGRDLAEKDLDACRTCHDADWCVSCHGIEMPHPSRFLPAHGPEAERLGGQTCVRCHPQGDCDDCHLRSAHPDIPGGGRMHEVAR